MRRGSAFNNEFRGGETQHVVHVSNLVSSTQAEFAPHSSIVVHCYSHAAIQSLKVTKKDPSDQWSSDTLDLSQKLQSTQNLSFTLHWIPSRIGIPGN